MSGLNNLVGNALRTAVQQAGGASAISGVMGAGAAPNPGATTTAVNGSVVINGQLQGLLRSIRAESNYNIRRQNVLSSAVSIALIPGVFEGSISFEKAFLFGQTLESAAGNILAPVVGKKLASNDFTASYFNLITLDNSGNPRDTYHDCILSTKTEVIGIEQVVITEEGQLMYRWKE